MGNTFTTAYHYINRETKAKYVWLKYRAILKGRILDVGADEGYLKRYLDKKTTYIGIDKGGNTERAVDLEKETIPFSEENFDCVICLDVLEHLDNIHWVFDELCRVTGHYIILALPNPWAEFYKMLRLGEYETMQPLKFYGLPTEPPKDRHKWFFSHAEAEAFIRYRARKNHMRVLQIDTYGMATEGRGWKKWIHTIARRVLLRGDLDLTNIYAGTLWAVLEKRK